THHGRCSQRLGSNPGACIDLERPAQGVDVHTAACDRHGQLFVRDHAQIAITHAELHLDQVFSQIIQNVEGELDVAHVTRLHIGNVEAPRAQEYPVARQVPQVGLGFERGALTDVLDGQVNGRSLASRQLSVAVSGPVVGNLIAV